MSHSVTGKLNKSAREFTAGDGVGFGIQLGERHYDRQTKQNAYTNYQGAIFASNPQQIDFYRSVLVEGSIIEVKCDQLKIDSFQGQNGLVSYNEMINARLGYSYSPEGNQGQPSGNSGQFGNQPPAQPQSYGHDWTGYEPTSSTNGATLDQVKRKYGGNLEDAIRNGHVVKAQQSGVINDFDDDIPF